MGKLLLIDGHSIMNRAYYGIPLLTNFEGIHTNAIYGFISMMQNAIDEEQADHIAVAFDVKEPTFRHKMFAEYKGTRKGMPDELREQIPLIQEVLHAMDIPVVTLPGFEADDILGTLAKRGQKDGYEVAILSGDRDLLQLADEHIHIRLPKTVKGQTTVENYDPALVLEKYQVTPKEFIDLKALMGDTSDNIPGVPGIGEKTATQIITTYHSIENAYAHVDEITPNKAKTNLAEHYDMAVMSKQLATIEIQAPVELSWEQALLGNIYTAEAFPLFERFELKSFMKRFTEDAKQAPQEDPADTFTLVEVLSDADKIILDAAKTRVGVGVLLEENEVLGIALSFDDHTFVLLKNNELSEAFLRESLHCLATETKISTINLKNIVDAFGVDINLQIDDLALVSYLLNPLKDSYDYDDLAREQLGLSLIPRKDLLQKQTLHELAFREPATLAKLVGYEAYCSIHCYDKLFALLDEQGMRKVYEEIELPVLYILRSMEREGIRVNKEALKSYGDELQEKITVLEKNIYEQAGTEFNINSPKQLGEILFEKLQLPSGKKTKTGYSTSADVLEKLADEYPVVRDILEYRTLTKLKSTYADGLADYIREDGRIHGTFNQTITATGRLSSTEPNLQNIPIRMEIGRMIRKVFIPKDGYTFIDADYSQIELRLLAHMSGDETLIEAYNEDRDIHRITASKVFHIPLEEVTPIQRSNAKAVNFGIVYGISSFGLSNNLSISKKEAKEYIEDYFKTFPRLKSYQDELVDFTKENGYAITLFGRRRPVPEIKESNFMRRQFGERIAMNSPLQGTAADIIKIAMIRVYERLQKENLKSRLILQIHDELLIETCKGEEEAVYAILREEMSHAANLSVRLEVDAHQGNDWYEAK